MIRFDFIGNPYPSFEQQEQDKARFIENLGPLKDEFERKGGIATFDYSKVDENGADIYYSLSEPHSSGLADFTRRWNEHLEAE